MCIFGAGRVVQITIWHLLGVIQLAHKHERVQMRYMHSAVFPQHSWELDGKTKLTSWLQISPIFGEGMVYRWNTFGAEIIVWIQQNKVKQKVPQAAFNFTSPFNNPTSRT